jgi:hypothetical protein
VLVRKLEEEFVDVTPAPVLSRLGRTNERMTRVDRVLAGVLMRRCIATTDASACETHP